MNESQISKKEIFIIVILMLLVSDLFFFVDVAYYDFSERITNKKDNIIECTVVDLESEDVYTLLDSMFIKYYSILEDSDGNTLKIQQTYKDYIGRKVWIYPDENHRHGIRKDYEIKRMNLFNFLCTICFPFSIWILIRMLTVLVKDRRNRK